MGLVPKGAYNNKKYLAGKYLSNDTPHWLEDILFDPQTSGGLLFSCAAPDAEKIVSLHERSGVKSAIIGSVSSFFAQHIVIE